MNNVIYRNQPSYSDARPERWMLSTVWAWSELGFTFETATVRHTQDKGLDLQGIQDLVELDSRVEASFDETFGI